MTENIDVFVQNSIRIKSAEGIFYVDPFRMDMEPHDAAYIFVTHDHFDHFSPEDIEKVAWQDTILVVPENMEKKAREAKAYVKQIVMVNPGVKSSIGNLKFETVPAYNINKPFHPQNAGWLGYIFETGGKRIYVAGDTDATKEAKTVKCDIALVPIGGTYTMDAKEAAELINIISPEVAIPTHYGSVVGKKEDEQVFAAAVKKPVAVEVKIKG